MANRTLYLTHSTLAPPVPRTRGRGRTREDVELGKTVVEALACEPLDELDERTRALRGARALAKFVNR